MQASNHVKDKDLASNACQIYGRNNHTAIKCFYKWDYSYQAVEDLPQALAAVNFQDTQAEDNAMYLTYLILRLTKKLIRYLLVMDLV